MHKKLNIPIIIFLLTSHNVVGVLVINHNTAKGMDIKSLRISAIEIFSRGK